MFEKLNPVDKLDFVLDYFVNMNNPPFKTDAEIAKELKFELTKEMFEIMHKLEKDGYITSDIISRYGQNITIYGSTFDGRLFYLNCGYNAKALAAAADKEQQKLEIDRLKFVDISSDQNQKTLNKLTNRLAWATWFAFVAAICLLGWQIYSYYHPTSIPVDVKIQSEKKP